MGGCVLNALMAVQHTVPLGGENCIGGLLVMAVEGSTVQV